MATLADVFRELNALRDDGIVREYAVGGAFASLFYGEATSTFDIGVSVQLPREPQRLIVLDELYAWARRRGHEPRGEHLYIHGVPVQSLVGPDSLHDATVANARELDYQGAPVRVMPPEHLVASYVLTGGARRRERAAMLLKSGACTIEGVWALIDQHGKRAEWQAAGGDRFA